MRRLALILLSLISIAYAQVTPVQKVQTIIQLKAYSGAAAFVFVADSSKLYATCSVCTADEVYIFAGTDGKKWKGHTTGTTVTVEQTLIDGNANAVAGNAVYDALALKLSHSDTAAMLLAYRTALLARVFYSDTANMLAAYRNALLTKVNYSDTAGLLAAYRNALNARVKYSDTSGMLAAYQTALNARQGTITTGTTAEYFRGDLSLATFPTVVGFFTNDAGYVTNATGNFIKNQSAVVQTAEFAITGPIRLGTNMTMDGRVRMIMKDNSSPSNESFAATLWKGANDIADLNMASGVAVKHSDDYSLTGGYAGSFQVYHEAKGLGGLVLGDNNFVRADTMTLGNYAPTVNDIANGYVAIELGPLQPKSEKFRWNNRGEAIFGWNNVRNYVASQTGNIVTDPVNDFFPSDVGKWFVWSNQDAGGKARFADRIIGYTDANHITVETNRTIASQAGRVSDAWAYVDTIGNARFRITHVDSLRIGTDAAYYRFVPSAGALSLLRVGSSTPDTLFDISGTSRLLTGRDIEINGSHQSSILFKNSTTSLFRISSTSVNTLFNNLTSAPTEFQNNGTVTFRSIATKTQSKVPFMIGGTDGEAAIAKLDVRNPDASITAYFDNTRGSGTNDVIRADVTANGATENRAGYFTANGGTTDKAIMIPSSSGSGVNDFAISSETTAKSYFAGLVKTDAKLQAINSPVGSSAADSVAKINRSTGDVEQVKLDTAAINSAGNTALNARQPLDADLTTLAGITLGSGVGTLLGTPSSANLATAITDETGSGAAVFGTSPTLSNPIVGTQSANDNSTKAASTAYIDNRYANEVSVYRTLGAPYIAEVVGTTMATMTQNVALTDGTAYLAAIPLPTATITGFRFYSSIQGNFTADNENSIALYSLSGSTLTRVAISANDANIWKQAGSSMRSAVFGTPYAATKGTYYIALLYNSSGQTAAPAIGAGANLNSANTNFGDFTTDVKMFGTVAATALGTTIAMSTVTASNQKFYIAAY